MLKQISWTEYFSVVAVLLAAYYSVVLMLYFRGDIWLLLSGKKKLYPAVAANPTSAAEVGVPEEIQLGEEKLYDVVNHLIPELKPLFQNDYIREELTMAIQLKLKDYGHLKGSAFQVAVNNFIRLEAEKQGSIMFSEDELRVLWI